MNPMSNSTQNDPIINGEWGSPAPYKVNRWVKKDSTQNKDQSQWAKYMIPVQLNDTDLEITIGMYARTDNKNVDLSQMQATGKLIPISDKEILLRMFDRRVSRPFWSLVNRIRSSFSKDE